MAQGRKTGGRAAGVPNKATVEFRQTVTALLEKNAANVDLWLQKVAEGMPAEFDDDGNKTFPRLPGDPGKALDLMAKLAEYAAPKLNRTEHVGDGGGAVIQRIEHHIVDPKG